MDFGQPFGGVIPGARGAVLRVLLRTGAPLTGRQIHSLISEQFSLWPVQEAIKELSRLGLIDTTTVGRAGMHSLNEHHAMVPALRSMLNPMDLLIAVVEKFVTKEVTSIIVFGSVSRGDTTANSDVDLAVIAETSWDQRSELAAAVKQQLGNNCDVVVFTPAEFNKLAHEDEPVVVDILRDGISLIGSMPQVGDKAI